MDNKLFDNLEIINSHVENCRASLVKTASSESLRMKQSVRESFLSKSNLEGIVESLSDVVAFSPTNYEDYIQSVESNLKYASFLAMGGKVSKVANSDYQKIVLATLLQNGHSLTKVKKNDQVIIKARKGDNAFRFSLEDVAVSRQKFNGSFKFKKQAAILPDERFVKKLAKQAYDTIMKLKPKDVSKAISGMIHTLWFDYAVDKNIYLSSMLYHEIRTKYLPHLKTKLGVNEIKYHAVDKRDKRLASYLEGIFKQKEEPKGIVDQVKVWFKEVPVRDLCDRIILMGELMGVEEDKLLALSNVLSKETNLEFSFA